ncbi:MAG: hypothetical protein A2W80_19245 [Candidatus Riflebacteria bacterium GWC2_50_8]|nr:MAG: hypothetical protein A2W80_19245 [Candidatus Riflebacteria bacterium GWC2_50_8]
MGRYSSGNQKNQTSGCGQTVIFIVAFILLIFSTVHEKAEKEKKQVVRREKAAGTYDPAARDIAARSDEDLLKIYSAFDADKAIDRNSRRSLLHVLCELNRFEVLDKMLENGASPNPRDKRGDTPMHSALRKKNLEAAAVLIKRKADLTAADLKGQTILHLAAETGNYEVAKEALRAGANINAEAYGFTPLHDASHRGHLRLVVLLCENGANTKYTFPQGWTAGDLAFGRYPEIVRYLASQKASFSQGYLVDKYELKDGWPFFGDNEITLLPDNHPAFLAVRENSPDQLAELDRNMVELDITNKAKTPLLILAIANDRFAAAGYLANYTKKINDADANGKTALMHSLAKGCKEVSRVLIKRGSKLDQLDTRGSSALHYAIARCDNDLVAELIDKGADIFAVDYFARGMMHVAAENSNEIIFPTLIANGCDVNQEDIRGNTALHLAAAANNTRILQALLTNGADFAVRNLSGKLAADLATSKEAARLLRNRFEIEGSNPAERQLPAEVHTLTTPTRDLIEQNNAR